MKYLGLLSVLWIVASSCAGTLPRRPCTEGGEIARPDLKERVNKQCFQRKQPSGRWVNDGPYIEWHKNGKRAVMGEYRMGLKHDKWSEWDAEGKLLSEKHYKNGKEVPRFDTADRAIRTTLAAPTEDKALAKPEEKDPVVTPKKP